MQENNDVYDAILHKVIFYEDVIKKTYISLNDYKKMNLIGSNEINFAINELNSIIEDLRLLEIHIKDKTMDIDSLVNDLQVLNNKLSNILKLYGTSSLEHLINICFGTDYFDKFITTDSDKSKFEILVNYTHPLSYKLVSQAEVKNSSKNSNPIVEDIYIAHNSCNLHCYANRTDEDNYNFKLNSMKIVIENKETKNNLVVTVLVDNMMIEYLLSNEYMYNLYYSVKDNLPKDDNFNVKIFESFYKSLNLKDFLINSEKEIFELYNSYMNSLKIFKNRPLSKIVSDFIKCDLFGKRKTLIQLLMDDDDTEFQYLAYLLYDSISNDDKNKPDTYEQILLFDSLPWNIKVKFRSAMKQTIEYTHNLVNSESSTKIPLEQRICLLKVSDSVKEKAMLKLKEVKSKSDDSTSKARQWLEGLLKIPFNIYRKEPIFDIAKSNITNFKNFIDSNKSLSKKFKLENISYNSLAISKSCKRILEELGLGSLDNQLEIINVKLDKFKKSKFLDLITYVGNITDVVDKSEIEKILKLKRIDSKREEFKKLLVKYKNTSLISDLVFQLDIMKQDHMMLYSIANRVMLNYKFINDYIKDCKQTLDKCVYGHTEAKRQIERIVGQWINGKDKGYCLGFEGPPGVGKTSLAKKGLAECLKDDNGESRPFSFIAIGGSSNGSTLEGHNYTYVGSQWGKIVDILMESKCMNPIIFIDEIDKVSRTESGKEIISILTHLIDPTQNDTIQDKYFSGVNLDLSKVLFVFSYNDVGLIDKILLDRIHRVKFEHLNLDEKLIICNKYLLPEIYENMGQEGSISFSEEVLKYIIEEYTVESGVRKLKELLFEIIGEINLEILNNDIDDIILPIHITNDDIKNKYLKNRVCLKEKKIHSESKVGIMNGLWANSYGRGGIIQIESVFIPSSNFLDLKLTGQQGDVMKESMSVAKSLAWKLSSDEIKEKLVEKHEKIKLMGIHIHCPDGATPKDGPSAGTAITVCLFSLLNNLKIKNDIAITGEINMQGGVTAIGGLDLKILGGIKAGVKQFLFPKENEKDFENFKDKYEHKKELDGIEFISIESISEALKYSIEDFKE